MCDNTVYFLIAVYKSSAFKHMLKFHVVGHRLNDIRFMYCLWFEISP